MTPNETEAELLTGIKVTDEASCSRAADALLGKGVKTVVITLGARGSFVATATSTQLVPGIKVKPVDTTAAGDTFNGALAVGLAEGMLLGDAVRFANAAGAISVTRIGAQPSAPMRKEIEKLLNDNKGVAVNGSVNQHLQGPHSNRRSRQRAGISH